ncbi:MAG TPA: C25 family cysteine peptidase [Herpetosiphonaceae bacterium]
MRCCFILILVFAPLLVPAQSRATVLLLTNPLVSRPDALRVRVTEAGLQQIAADALTAAGWDLAAIDPRHVHLWHQGQPQPLDVTDGHDGRLDPQDTLQFIGRLNGSRFSRESVYWLSVEATPGLRGTPQFAPGDPLRWEDDALYQTRWPSLHGDRWYGRELVNVPERDHASIRLALPVSAPAGTRLQLAVVGTTVQTHTLALTANGHMLDPITWSGREAYLGSVRLPFTVLPGVLQLDVTIADSHGDRVLLDWVALPDIRPAYPATPRTPLVERGPVFDPRQGPAPNQSSATYLIITHHTLRPALDPLIAAHRQRGEAVGVVDVQTAYDAWSWGERDPEAIRSLIRTAVAQWQPAPRAVLLVGAGNARMRVEPGTPDPTFIPPYFVDADPSRGEIACDTCYTRIDTSDPLDDPLPDLPIGRLPARTLADAQTIVRKTARLLTAPPAGSWRTQALLVTDNDREADGRVDPAGSFVATAERAAALLPLGMHTQQFSYAPDRPTGQGYYRDVAELRCRLFRALDGGSPHDRACPLLPSSTEPGAALWIYVGHGSPWQWAETTPNAPTPYLWYLYDADARTNGERLPILLSLTCLSGDWANPTLMTTDERLVLHGGGGVVASLSATGQGVNTGHARFLDGLLPTLFAPSGERTLGSAHLAGLRAVLASGEDTDLAYSFGILGDPLVTLPFVPTVRAWVPLVGR